MRLSQLMCYYTCIATSSLRLQQAVRLQPSISNYEFIKQNRIHLETSLGAQQHNLYCSRKTDRTFCLLWTCAQLHIQCLRREYFEDVCIVTCDDVSHNSETNNCIYSEDAFECSSKFLSQLGVQEPTITLIETPLRLP